MDTDVNNIRSNPVDRAKLSFKRVSAADRQADLILRPPSTYLKDSLYNLSRNPLGMIGAAVIIFMIIFAVLGPMVLPYEFDRPDYDSTYQSSSTEHWMGTDILGRDMTVRIAHGARASLLVGFTASLLSITVGVFYGAISGYMGGKTDLLMMRVVEIFSSVPSIMYIILLAQIFPQGGLNIIVVVIGLTTWMSTARVVRGDILSLKTREFVLAARVSNVSNFKIITRHMIPNCIGPIIVSLTFNVPGAIFTEATLRYLGVASAVTPSWGSLVNDSLGTLHNYPYLLLFPALFLSVTMLAFTLFSDALLKALDPKKR